ncbi:MAG: ComF family protein [Verrucomicrobiota bacterium]
MNSIAWWRKAAVGWVYPPICAGCDEVLPITRQLEFPFLCADCESRLPGLKGVGCLVCGQHYETPPGVAFRCSNCHDRELGFDYAVSAIRNTGLARDLMHRFKYGKQVHLSRLMGALMKQVWADERLRRRDHWWVIPVPLHFRRERERGFNQSVELAKAWVKSAPEGIDLSYRPILKRVTSTVRQAQLDRVDRLENPNGVFAVRSSYLRSIRKKPRSDLGAILVDDVMTTGATVSECARVLRETGQFDEIVGISAMRG